MTKIEWRINFSFQRKKKYLLRDVLKCTLWDQNQAYINTIFYLFFFLFYSLLFWFRFSFTFLVQGRGRGEVEWEYLPFFCRLIREYYCPMIHNSILVYKDTLKNAYKDTYRVFFRIFSNAFFAFYCLFYKLMIFQYMQLFT